MCNSLSTPCIQQIMHAEIQIIAMQFYIYICVSLSEMCMYTCSATMKVAFLLNINTVIAAVMLFNFEVA